MNKAKMNQNCNEALPGKPGKDNRFAFTVKQLQKVLAGLPQDLPVLVSGYESGYENFYSPILLKLKHFPENMYYEGEFQLAEDEETETFNAVVLERVMRND